MEVSGHATHTARKEKEVEADFPVTHTDRKQKEMKVDVMFFSLFSFIQFRTTKHGMVLPTFRVDSLSSVSPLWKYPYTHAQRCLSWVIPHLVTVTIRINHRRQYFPVSAHPPGLSVTHLCAKPRPL